MALPSYQDAAFLFVGRLSHFRPGGLADSSLAISGCIDHPRATPSHKHARLAHSFNVPPSSTLAAWMSSIGALEVCKPRSVMRVTSDEA